MITHLLDTSALPAHYRKQSGWGEVNRLLADGSLSLGFCAVSITELGSRRLHRLARQMRPAIRSRQQGGGFGAGRGEVVSRLGNRQPLAAGPGRHDSNAEEEDLKTVGVSTAEAAVGLALIIAIYRHYKTTNVDEVNSLKG